MDILLDYFLSVLPPLLYSYLSTFLSHILALLALVSSIISTKPSEWDVQTVLPPIISLLAAYLALLSLYRTTTWAIRTSAWFIKWGLILAVLLGGTGWLVNVTKDLVTPGISDLSDFVLDVINGQGRNPASSNLPSKSRARRKGSRPKPWDSFKRHREWKNQQQDPQSDTQKYIADLVDVAGRMVTGSRWWEVVKSIVNIKETGSSGKGAPTGTAATATGKSSRPR